MKKSTPQNYALKFLHFNQKVITSHPAKNICVGYMPSLKNEKKFFLEDSTECCFWAFSVNLK